MPKRWLTVLLLAVLALLLMAAWPDNRADGDRADGGHDAQGAARAWSLPPPMDETLFEDFSAMPRQGPPARLVPPEPQKQPASSRHQWSDAAEKRGKIALIIDDIGYDLHAEKRLLALPFPVAISVLPQAPHAKRAAILAHDHGQVVMLHLPMEPDNPSLQRHLGSSFLRLGMSDAELQQKFAEALSRVPFVQGVNNHMGSLLTADHQAMVAVMASCLRRKLFFVDSRTGPHSVAAKEAERAGLRWAARKVFLDHIDDSASIAQAWHHAQLIADRHGSCVVIAHPRKKTVAFLATLIDADVRRMVPITKLLQ